MSHSSMNMIVKLDKDESPDIFKQGPDDVVIQAGYPTVIMLLLSINSEPHRQAVKELAVLFGLIQEAKP